MKWTRYNLSSLSLACADFDQSESPAVSDIRRLWRFPAGPEDWRGLSQSLDHSPILPSLPHLLLIACDVASIESCQASDRLCGTTGSRQGASELWSRLPPRSLPLLAPPLYHTNVSWAFRRLMAREHHSQPWITQQQDSNKAQTVQ